MRCPGVRLRQVRLYIEAGRKQYGPVSSICAKRFTSHCKKNSNHSRRRSTSAFPESGRQPANKSAKSGNRDLQYLREMTLRSALSRQPSWVAESTGWHTLVVDVDLEDFRQ